MGEDEGMINEARRVESQSVKHSGPRLKVDKVGKVRRRVHFSKSLKRSGGTTSGKSRTTRNRRSKVA